MSARIVCIGDVHLIADDDPETELHSQRAFFKDAWPSFSHLLEQVNEVAPDLVVLLGDLLDWYSPANLSFGLELLSRLRRPWVMVPGNHDIQLPDGGHDRSLLSNWSEAGVELGHRCITIDGWRCILGDNALSTWPGDHAQRVADDLGGTAPSILCAHVPFALPGARAFIASIPAPRRMEKYLHQDDCGMIEQACRTNLRCICTGHIHLGTSLRHERCLLRLCPLGISCFDPGRRESSQATATVLDLDGEQLSRSTIVISP